MQEHLICTNIPYIFNPWDNAMNTQNFRGLIITLIKMFERIKKEGPITTDIHESYQCRFIKRCVDLTR